MSRVRRNNAPAELNAPSLCGNDGENSSGGTSFKSVLATPGIRFCNPECVEAGVFASFRHRGGFVHRFHAQLQDAYVEWDAHPFSCAPLVRVPPGVLETLN